MEAKHINFRGNQSSKEDEAQLLAIRTQTFRKKYPACYKTLMRSLEANC